MSFSSIPSVDVKAHLARVQQLFANYPLKTDEQQRQHTPSILRNTIKAKLLRSQTRATQTRGENYNRGRTKASLQGRRSVVEATGKYWLMLLNR